MTRKLAGATGVAALLLLFLAIAPAQAQPQPQEQPQATGNAPGGIDAAASPSFDLDIRAPQPLRGVLERHLDLRRYREVSDLDDAELTRLVRMADEEVRELAATLGYFSPDVQITREPGKRPTIVVAVEPGQLTMINEVAIEFEGDIARSEEADAMRQREGIRADWRLPIGRPFTQSAWDDAKDAALQRLLARRYPAGKISYSLADIDAPARRARLGLRLDSGPLFRLGPMQVSGVERYNPVLVPRIARLPVGSIYDRERILQAQLRLAGSGYFDSAFILVDPQSDPQAAPVQVTVREAPLQKVVLGVGLTTDSGPRVSIEHIHNRVPGIGWRALSKLQIDRKTPHVQTELTGIPDESGWRWAGLARAERLDDGSLVTHAQQLRFGRLRSEEHIDRNVYVQYERATVQTTEGAAVPSEESGAGSALSANYVWTGRYFDSVTFPTRGHGLGLELGGGVTLGGNRAVFQRTVFRGLFLRPLKQGRLQLRGEAGAVLVRSDARVPSTQLFRTGGDTTVRGYEFREIGVTLPGGQTGPGRYMAVASVEWQKPIRWGGRPTEFEGVAFVDAGGVADRVRDIRLSTGVGAGVRWKSPVGAVQADIAYGVESKKVRLHMRVGFSF